MGKKYEAYQRAEQAEGLAKMRLTDTEGGSTRQAMNEAKTNAEQARLAADDAWQSFIADPEG